MANLCEAFKLSNVYNYIMHEVIYGLPNYPRFPKAGDDEFLRFYRDEGSFRAFGVFVDAESAKKAREMADDIAIHVTNWLSVLMESPQSCVFDAVEQSDNPVLKKGMQIGSILQDKGMQLVMRNLKKSLEYMDDDNLPSTIDTLEEALFLYDKESYKFEREALEFAKQYHDKKCTTDNEKINSLYLQDKTECLSYCRNIIRTLVRFINTVVEDDDIVMGKEDEKKYPFLVNIPEYFKNNGFDPYHPTSIVGDDWNPADIALERITAALNGEQYDGKPDVYSFAFSIILLNLYSLRNEQVFEKALAKFAMQEAITAINHLKKDLSGDNIEIALQTLKKFHLNAETIPNDRAHLSISILDYLHHARHIQETEWHLVNKHPVNGKIMLRKGQAARLVRAEIIKKIRNIAETSGALSHRMFRSHVVKLAELLEPLGERESKYVDGKYPPCIIHAMRELEDGQNLSHPGRFMLGTYFLARGMYIDDIAEMFVNAPDYNERVTKYQLAQLQTAKYQCGSCDKLDQQQLCYATKECEKISHPLQFARKGDYDE